VPLDLKAGLNEARFSGGAFNFPLIC